MLVTSIYSFSHYIFKRSFPKGGQKLSSCGKGLIFSFTVFKEKTNYCQRPGLLLSMAAESFFKNFDIVLYLLFMKLLKSFIKQQILDESKLKVFADNKIKFSKMVIFVFDRVKNIVEKEKTAFSPFPQCFQKASDTGSLIIV